MLELSRIGYGAFKIGRNTGTKYPDAYTLPSDDEATALLEAVVDLGITHIDTAPAYGLSEARIGRALAHRRDEIVISTKVGETFEKGTSTYDFSSAAVRASVERSLGRLGTDVLDLVLIHSDGRDLEIIDGTDAVATLSDIRAAGDVRAIGLSAKTVEGARAALDWADAIMVEYTLEDRSHEEVIEEAHARGVAVIVKKALASGRLDPERAVRFVLSNPGVTNLVLGSLSLEHLRLAVTWAERR